MADIVDALRPHGIREKVPVPILGTDQWRIGESSDVLPNAEVDGVSVYLTGGGREESMLPTSRVPMLQMRPSRKPQFESKSTISDMSKKWSQTLGSQGRAQLDRLKANKNLRRSLGIDDMVFNAAVRGSDNGDVDSVKYLEQFTGPLEHLRYERGVAEQKEGFKQEIEELRGKEGVKAEAYGVRQNLKLKTDKLLATHKAGLKPEAAQRVDQIIRAFDQRMENVQDERLAEQQTADIINAADPALQPILKQRLQDHLRENLGEKAQGADRSTEAKQRDWQQAMARAQALKDRTPEERRAVLGRLAREYSLDPAAFVEEAELSMPRKTRRELNNEWRDEMVYRIGQGYNPTPNEQRQLDAMNRVELGEAQALKRQNVEVINEAGKQAKQGVAPPVTAPTAQVTQPGSDEFFAQFGQLAGQPLDPEEIEAAKADPNIMAALLAMINAMRQGKK